MCMKSNNIVIIVFAAFVFAGCSHFQQKEAQSLMSKVEDGMSKQSANSQQNESQTSITKLVNKDILRSSASIEDVVIAMKTYSMSASQDNYLRVLNLSKDLKFDFKELNSQIKSGQDTP